MLLTNKQKYFTITSNRTLFFAFQGKKCPKLQSSPYFVISATILKQGGMPVNIVKHTSPIHPIATTRQIQEYSSFFIFPAL